MFKKISLSLILISLCSLLIMGETVAEPPSVCNKINYKDFIYNKQKTDQLIKETGSGCDLLGLDFRGRDLSKADLRLAAFYEADLRGADLRGANLRSEADLKTDTGNQVVAMLLLSMDEKGINFLFLADLTGAIYNDQTRFPVGFDKSQLATMRKLDQ